MQIGSFHLSGLMASCHFIHEFALSTLAIADYGKSGHLALQLPHRTPLMTLCPSMLEAHNHIARKSQMFPQNCLVKMYLFLIDLRLAIGYLSEARTGGKQQLAISNWQLATARTKPEIYAN
jgi:hypothetical protein